MVAKEIFRVSEETKKMLTDFVFIQTEMEKLGDIPDEVYSNYFSISLIIMRKKYPELFTRTMNNTESEELNKIVDYLHKTNDTINSAHSP